MKFLFSKKAQRDYENLTKASQKTADKQFNFLLQNLRHPSLQAKKYDEAKDIWQARISKDLRFYFQIRRNTYFLITIIKHPK